MGLSASANSVRKVSERVCIEPTPSFYACAKEKMRLRIHPPPQHRVISQKPYLCWHWRREITLANGPRARN